MAMEEGRPNRGPATQKKSGVSSVLTPEKVAIPFMAPHDTIYEEGVLNGDIH